MPRKGMRSIFFKSPSPSRMTPPQSPLRISFSDSLVDENVDTASFLISKWDTTNNIHHNSLFALHREEAKQYLSSVKNLQSAMHYYMADNPSSDKLVYAQNLMQKAIKRLEKEFYEILRTNRQNLDAESVSVSVSTLSSRASRSSLSDLEDEWEDESGHGSESTVSEAERVSMVAMDDLKAIADCMISSGYGKECVKIYKIIRKSIVDEGLYQLGVDRLTLQQIQKLNWEVLENKIKHWLHAVKVGVKSLFYGERILCDHVFSSSVSMREACFADICKEGAMNLFGFPENVAKCKKTPEKMFRTLDLYEAISDLWPEIDSIFNFESISAVKLQAINSLIKLGDAVRTMLTDFESAIQKDTSKSPIQGGGVHPLTRYVMNYITFLADYSGSLTDIVADWPLTVPSPLPEAYFGSPDESISSPISVRLAWLILVLLCKLDGKTELYKDVAQSYLFLANNLQYVVVKVQNSNLRFLLGEDWILKHEAKVKQYASNYERMGWSKVFASLPENQTAEISPEQVRECFRRFNISFEDACKKQTSWVVPDPKLRDEIKVSVAKKIVPVYRELYDKYRVGLRSENGLNSLVRFTPDDLGNYLSDLFFGAGSSGSVSSHSSHSRGPSH